jgi:hypothetical protein
VGPRAIALGDVARAAPEGQVIGLPVFVVLIDVVDVQIAKGQIARSQLAVLTMLAVAGDQEAVSPVPFLLCEATWCHRSYTSPSAR